MILDNKLTLLGGGIGNFSYASSLSGVIVYA